MLLAIWLMLLVISIQLEASIYHRNDNLTDFKTVMAPARWIMALSGIAVLVVSFKGLLA